MRSPHVEFKIFFQVKLLILLASFQDAVATNKIDKLTEQRIIREQNRVVQNQQIAIEVDQRTRDADLIERQISSSQRRYFLDETAKNYFSDFSKIKEGCSIINSSDLLNDAIPSNPPIVAFFHSYLLVKSFYPQHLSSFDCAKKLEEQAIPLFALDRKPLDKAVLSGDLDSQILHLHREIIRNLYQIVRVSRDNNNKIIQVSGIQNGLLFADLDYKTPEKVKGGGYEFWSLS